MEQYSMRPRLKWVKAILCAVLSPLAGMVVSAGISWPGGLTGGIAAGGILGLTLYFGILRQELNLKEHWRDLALSVPVALLVSGYLLVRRQPAMAVLLLVYIPVFMTLFPHLQELDKKTAAAAKKPLTIPPDKGFTALALWAAVFFFLGLQFPMLRALLWTPLGVFLVGAVLWGGAVLLSRRLSIGVFQQAVRAYNEQCDPRPLLAVCERKLSKRLFAVARQRWLLQKAVALADLGDAERADQITNMLLSQQKVSEEIRAACFFNLAESYCNLGSLAAAEDCHAKSVACAERCKPGSSKETQLGHLGEQEGFLLLCAGDCQGAKARFLELGWETHWEDSTKPLSLRVFHAYKLGLACLGTGDTALARDNLNFAAEHGNQLAVAGWAKEATL